MLPDDRVENDGDPLVSVVVPAFNGSRYIERTLRSISVQTYRSLEIIVVNDGSTDDTLDIVTAFAAHEPRLRVVSTVNGGVARARNTGISLARGEFVAFVDADDLWHPIKIAEQVRAMTGPEGRHFGASYTLHRIINQDEKLMWQTRSDVCSGSMLARHLTGKFVGNGSSIMARRDVLIEVEGYDPSYADAGIGGCEDLDSELRIAARYPMVGIRSYLVGYRVYPGNMSSNRRRMARSIIETMERHLARNPDLPALARRYAKASTNSWTAEILLADRHFTDAAKAVREVFGNDWRAGLSLVRTLLTRTFNKLFRAKPVLGGPSAPNFYDVDPLAGVTDRIEVPNLVRWMAALEPIDAARAERLRQPKPFEGTEVGAGERMPTSAIL